MSYFYISFATDDGFRGATVVEAGDEFDAMDIATEHGLNPGGEAAIFEISAETIESEPHAKSMINRLVGKDELVSHGGKRHGDLSPEDQARVDSAALKVCADCNRT